MVTAQCNEHPEVEGDVSLHTTCFGRVSLWSHDAPGAPDMSLMTLTARGTGHGDGSKSSRCHGQNGVPCLPMKLLASLMN